MNKVFKIFDGSLQQRFQNSRAKVQIFAGGFANGKTSNAVIKALQLCKDYPGSNGLIARATYPKLNDTIRAEFIKWCPSTWIKSFPLSKNSDNTCILKNGTHVNFRYAQQQGKGQDNPTSNLLSATYDWIVVDQIDDPEFVAKDLLDLIGRLRGSTRYTGNDPTMPQSGPRCIILTSNPTRGWFYKTLVRPLQTYAETQRVSPELAVMLDAFGVSTPDGLIEMYEGSTYENKNNLEPDYIQLLEAMYVGQMHDRFILGKWGAYEGLIYPTFQDDVHVLKHNEAVAYYNSLVAKRYDVEIVEGYDHGLAVPSCYGFAFVDLFGNIIMLDGFYQKEATVQSMIVKIKQIRREYLGSQEPKHRILADPQIFKRGTGTKLVVGGTVADIFHDHGQGVKMERGNNEIMNGITKVGSYLQLHRFHRHPMTGKVGAPYLYVSDKLSWWIEEVTNYFWKRNDAGEYEDIPTNRNDHAMDMTKYLLSRRPRISAMLQSVKRAQEQAANLLKWGEREVETRNKAHRYG